MRLNNQRQSGMSVNPLSYSDINSFFNLIDVDVTEEELNIILLLDRVVLDHYAEEQKKMEKRNTK